MICYTSGLVVLSALRRQDEKAVGMRFKSGRSTHPWPLSQLLATDSYLSAFDEGL